MTQICGKWLKYMGNGLSIGKQLKYVGIDFWEMAKLFLKWLRYMRHG